MENDVRSQSKLPYLAIVAAVAIAYIFANRKGAATVATPTPAAPVAAQAKTPEHPVFNINIGECNYLLFENPFFILHRGDCTNHVSKK